MAWGILMEGQVNGGAGMLRNTEAECSWDNFRIIGCNKVRYGCLMRAEVIVLLWQGPWSTVKECQDITSIVIRPLKKIMKRNQQCTYTSIIPIYMSLLINIYIRLHFEPINMLSSDAPLGPLIWGAIPRMTSGAVRYFFPEKSLQGCRKSVL